jgi:hypothetical protein
MVQVIFESQSDELWLCSILDFRTRQLHYRYGSTTAYR